MEQLTELWSLSLNQTILLVAVILIVSDFFFFTDISTHIAYILLSVLVAINIDAQILIKILCALLTWFAAIAFHYFIWRKSLIKVVNMIAPDRLQTGAEGVIGDSGIIREVDGAKMVKVKGDLWPCHGAEALTDGTQVTVVSAKDGTLEVK